MEKKAVVMMMFWAWAVLGFCQFWVGNGLEYANVSEIEHLESFGVSVSNEAAEAKPLMVDLTLIRGADSKGAVCLDGTLPGYHWHQGFGSGANSWLVELEGGGWCNNIRTCVYRKKTRRGSSNYMEKQIPFTGLLSNKAEENPDFFNWNRVKVRYCDGASFAGEGHDEASNMYFRGQRIWSAAMEELMTKGMHNADRALLSGCSAGGLASILHCDQFSDLLPKSTKVKCLSDAGLFLNAMDVSGGRTLQDFFHGVVTLQGVEKNLPSSCTKHLNPTLCFFPENLIADIKTPMFLLNAAYDSWQVQASLAPSTADPHGEWRDCKMNHAHCSSSQIQFLQNFRTQMLDAVKGFSGSRQNGIFINSCFAHCQSERQDTWFSDDSPVIQSKVVNHNILGAILSFNYVHGHGCIYVLDRFIKKHVFLCAE